MTTHSCDDITRRSVQILSNLGAKDLVGAGTVQAMRSEPNPKLGHFIPDLRVSLTSRLWPGVRRCFGRFNCFNSLPPVPKAVENGSIVPAHLPPG
jgi:hypothetical protein